MVLRLVAVLTFLFVGSISAAKPILIVTDISPVTLIVSGVVNDLADIEQLIEGHVSPHDFVLRPSDIFLLQKADLIIWMGPVASPGLAKIIGREGLASKAVALEDHLAVSPLPKRSTGVFDPDVKADGLSDPHTWLHPLNALGWVDVIAIKMTGIDSENRMNYRGNGENMIGEINDTRTAIETMLVAKPPLPFVQFHDAFQYFETAFGLQAIGAVTSGDKEAASLGVVAKLNDALSGFTASCIFVENVRQEPKIRQFMHAKNMQIEALDALGNMISPNAETYPDLLLNIAKGFSNCQSEVSK